MCSSYDPVLFSESKTLVHKLKQLNRIMTDNYYCIVVSIILLRRVIHMTT